LSKEIESLRAALEKKQKQLQATRQEIDRISKELPDEKEEIQRRQTDLQLKFVELNQNKRLLKEQRLVNEEQEKEAIESLTETTLQGISLTNELSQVYSQYVKLQKDLLDKILD
jgi:chromosome segregation ATPase